MYQNQRTKQVNNLAWAIGLVVILAVAVVLVLATHHSDGTPPSNNQPIISNTLNTVSNNL